MYGDQFPRYFPECVTQLPLSRKDHIVVSSNLNFSGASLIRISPFFLLIILLPYLFVYKKISIQTLNISYSFLYNSSYICFDIICESTTSSAPIFSNILSNTKKVVNKLYQLSIKKGSQLREPLMLSNYKLLDNCSNTSRSYCTSTFTLFEYRISSYFLCFLVANFAENCCFCILYFNLFDFLAPFWHRIEIIYLS